MPREKKKELRYEHFRSANAFLGLPQYRPAYLFRPVFHRCFLALAYTPGEAHLTSSVA